MYTFEKIYFSCIIGMVYNDQFLQIATNLPANSNVYGFGENNHPTLSHDMNFKTWGMFARDQANVAGENTNQYGVQPFYQVVERDGNSHGVLLVNSNAQEYSFTTNPALIWRSIGGIFDFYFFSGPEPESVTQQYVSLVGYPMMVPFWSLGFQLSRWEYKDLADMKRIVSRNLAAGIPLDVQYADIEHYRDQMDFTIDEKKFGDLPNYFRELQSKGMRTVIILDPALVIDRGGPYPYKPYVDGIASDVYIKWPTGQSPDYAEMKNDIMIGYCWPNDKVAYPDFLNNRTWNWWIQQIIDYRKVNITFDALWIDMNEPVK
jgi:alpha-glucosidase (family GH31 glycosyl hydrolase)